VAPLQEESGILNGAIETRSIRFSKTADCWPGEPDTRQRAIIAEAKRPAGLNDAARGAPLA